MAAHWFSDETLDALLTGLQARAATHPESPWLIACWPSVSEDRMAAGCVELVHRGHEIRRVRMPGRTAGATRMGYAVRGEPLTTVLVDQTRRKRWGA